MTSSLIVLNVPKDTSCNLLFAFPSTHFATTITPKLESAWIVLLDMGFQALLTTTVRPFGQLLRIAKRLTLWETAFLALVDTTLMAQIRVFSQIRSVQNLL